MSSISDQPPAVPPREPPIVLPIVQPRGPAGKQHHFTATWEGKNYDVTLSFKKEVSEQAAYDKFVEKIQGSHEMELLAKAFIEQGRAKQITLTNQGKKLKVLGEDGKTQTKKTDKMIEKEFKASQEVDRKETLAALYKARHDNTLPKGWEDRLQEVRHVSQGRDEEGEAPPPDKTSKRKFPLPSFLRPSHAKQASQPSDEDDPVISIIPQAQAQALPPPPPPDTSPTAAVPPSGAPPTPTPKPGVAATAPTGQPSGAPPTPTPRPGVAATAPPPTGQSSGTPPTPTPKPGVAATAPTGQPSGAPPTPPPRGDDDTTQSTPAAAPPPAGASKIPTPPPPPPKRTAAAGQSSTTTPPRPPSKASDTSEKGKQQSGTVKGGLAADLAAEIAKRKQSGTAATTEAVKGGKPEDPSLRGILSRAMDKRREVIAPPSKKKADDDEWGDDD